MKKSSDQWGGGGVQTIKSAGRSLDLISHYKGYKSSRLSRKSSNTLSTFVHM